MSKSFQRINQIESIVKERSTISVKNLAELLQVSEMTIRRDLAILECNPHIKNVRGLIIYDKSPFANQYNVSHSIDTNPNEKMRIGEAAAAMVRDDDIIMLDIGSTIGYLAKALSPDLKATVICTTYNALSYLTSKKNLKVYCTGGFFHADTQLMETWENIPFLNHFRATKLFASAAGVHKELGVTCAYNYEVPIKRALIDSSAERILLIDSSKFGCIRSCCFTNISYYHTVITDTNITPEWEEYLLQKDIELIKV